jgi:hypothetical protein
VRERLDIARHRMGDAILILGGWRRYQRKIDDAFQGRIAVPNVMEGDEIRLPYYGEQKEGCHCVFCEGSVGARCLGRNKKEVVEPVVVQRMMRPGRVVEDLWVLWWQYSF